MRRNIQIGILSLLALLFSAFLLLDVAYFVIGSQELFPTHEQQGKIRDMTVLAGIGFALAEVAVLVLLGRLFRD